MAQKKYPILNTPKGVAVWPNLSAPDTKFKPEGEYTCKLAFDPNLPEVQALISKLETIRDELFAEEVKNAETPVKKKQLEKYELAPVYADELDKDGEETGRITINFKMKASGVSKKTNKPWKRKPTIFDSKGKELKNPPVIGGGSVLRVACEMGGGPVPSAKKFYLSPKLVGVKLIELVTFGSVSSKDMGFDEDEGGYEAEEADNSVPFDTEETEEQEESGGSADF